MMPRWYLVWLGAGVALVIAMWWLSRRVASPASRQGLRCLGVAAVLTPQPLWIPGEGGAVIPALLNLLSGHPLFGVTMGAFPIFAAATILFVVLGWRLARAAAARERLVHQVARRWVVVGLILPLLALACSLPSWPSSPSADRSRSGASRASSSSAPRRRSTGERPRAPMRCRRGGLAARPGSSRCSW